VGAPDSRLRKGGIRLAWAASLSLFACGPREPASRALPFDPPPGPEASTSATAALPAFGPPFAPVLDDWALAEGAVRGSPLVVAGSCDRLEETACACATDRVFVADETGVVSAFDGEGVPVWTHACAGPLRHGPERFGADRIAIRCGDGAVTALRTTDGAVLWRVARDPGVSAPLGVSEDGTRLIAADLNVASIRASGAIEWSRPEVGPFSGRPWSSEGRLVATALDGRVWGLGTTDGLPLWRARVTGGVEGGVAALDDGSVCVATLYGRVYRIDPAAGTTRWESTVGRLVRGTPAQAADGTILVPVMDGAVVGLDPGDGSRRWRHAVPGEVIAEPLPLAGEAAGGGVGAAIGDRGGFLYGLGGPRGTGPMDVRWSVNVGLPIESRPAPFGDGLLVGLGDGRIVRVRPGAARCAGAPSDRGASR
jgi:outer membrane protein assembly factor BamB